MALSYGKIGSLKSDRLLNTRHMFGSSHNDTYLHDVFVEIMFKK